jgi:Fic family protein
MFQITITPEILNLISELDEFKGAWQLLSKLPPGRLRVLKKVATIESIGSSTRIEGVKLTDGQIEALLMEVDKHSFRSRDEEEVAGYASLIEDIFVHFSSIPLNENTIKQLHGMLLQYSSKDERHKGEYKKIESHIEAFDATGKSLGVIFETTSAFETPFKMQELLSWISETLKTKSLHPLLVIGIFIVTFLAIHPFQDGNGRLSRCITTLLLLQSGYAYVPFSSLESVIEENKESYYLALRRTQQTLKGPSPDYYPWILFFLHSLIKQKKLLEEKLVREHLLSVSLSPLSSRIVGLLESHGRLNVNDLERLTASNRNTLKKHLQELVKTGHIQKHGKGRATWYTTQL